MARVEAAFGREIEHLPADHAAEAGGARERRDQLECAPPASGCVSGRAEDVEGEGQQAVAGEDGGRLVECLVRGRPAAAQIVIVHRGQVVVHQRVAMHAFERRAGHQGLLARRPRTARRDSTTRNGPQPLAAAEARIAHGIEQARRPGLLAVRRWPAQAGDRAAPRCRRRPDRGDPERRASMSTSFFTASLRAMRVRTALNHGLTRLRTLSDIPSARKRASRQSTKGSPASNFS